VKKRFSIEQITAVLQQAEQGVPVGDLCRKVGISEQSFYRWKKVYGGLQPSEARELKQLREENTKLKRLVADLSLDKVMLQDVVQKNDGPLHSARHPHDEWRACENVFVYGLLRCVKFQDEWRGRDCVRIFGFSMTTRRSSSQDGDSRTFSSSA
jgi:putative transposase